MVSLHTHYVISGKWLIPEEIKAISLVQELGPSLGPLTNTLQPKEVM